MNFHLLSFQIYCDPPKYTKNSIMDAYLFDTPNYMEVRLVMIPGIYFHFNCFFPYQENIKGRFENGVMNEKFEEFCADLDILKLKI